MALVILSSIYVLSMKIINLKKQSFYTYQSTLKVEELIMYTSPQHLWTSNSPSIVQMTSNLAQGCTITCEMMFAPCPANLVCNFQKNHAKTQIQGSICEASTKMSLCRFIENIPNLIYNCVLDCPRKSEKIIQGTKVVIIHRSTYSFETFNFQVRMLVRTNLTLI